jgi:hypothetical protein
LEVGSQEYFIDILLYHRHHRCLVTLELKVGAFEPEYVGKMQFYPAVLDDKVKTEHENSSVDILLCRNRNKTVVECALKNTADPLGVVPYQRVKKLPRDLEGQLPTPEQVERLMGEMDA